VAHDGDVSSWKTPPGWRKLRLQVFARDGRACYRCGAYANSVDHVLPVALGGTHALSNLRPACSRCNSSTGASLGNRMYPRTPPPQLRGWIAAGRPSRSARKW
jgi:5-methylcytosine-specific restriction endonuclease McrA